MNHKELIRKSKQETVNVLNNTVDELSKLQGFSSQMEKLASVSAYFSQKEGKNEKEY